MNHVARFRPVSTKPVFKTFFDDIFNAHTGSFNRDFALNSPSVNVIENAEAHIIELAAPGLEKGDFKVNIEKNHLTISAEKNEDKDEKSGNFVRKEFSFHSFSKTFKLPETVDTSKIEASYKNGVLYLTLPKKEEAKEQPPRKIEIG